MECGDRVTPEYVCEVTYVDNCNNIGNKKWPLLLKERDVYLKLVSGKNRRYVTISHVWKENDSSNLSHIEKLPDGVNWKVMEDPSGKIYSVCSAVTEIVGDNLTIWIDSVCVDQDDEPKLALEVAKMGDIYANAEATYVVLSTMEARDAAETLCSMIYRNKDTLYKPRKDGECPTMCEWEEGNQTKYLETLNVLITDRWFSRCWTLQETLLSKKIFILIGNKNFVDLRKLLLYGNGFYKLALSKKSGYRYNLAKQCNKYNALQLLYNNTQKHISAHYCLHLLRNRSCERDEDIVYSIRGVLSYGKYIPVNYKIGAQNVMKYFVEIGIKHGDYTMLCCLSPYSTLSSSPSYLPILKNVLCCLLPYSTICSSPSYLPILNNGLISDIKNTACCDPAWPYNGVVEDSKINIKGIVIGKIVKAHKKMWNYSDNLQKQIERIGKTFCFEKNELLKCGVGIIDVKYDVTNKLFKKNSQEENSIETITESFNAAWNYIILVKLDKDVNADLSAKNCVFCKQGVVTSEAIGLRNFHTGHKHVYSSNVFLVQAAGTPEQGNFVIDIGVRTWAGIPVFITASYDKAKKAYSRTGVTRDTIAVIGGKAYDKNINTITLI